ncbi:hypothetical protein Tco_0481457, partial [Tanacetum coccineum]
DLAFYDNESWNDPRDFAKPVKAIALPQDVPSTSNRRLIELENQVQCLMEAHLAPKQPTQVNKITTSCEICNGPYDTLYCMKDPEQAFVEYASSRTDEAGDARLSKFEADFKRQQGEMTNKIDTVLKAIIDQIAGTLPSDTPEESQVNEPDVGSLGNINSNPHPQPDPLASIATEQVRKLNLMLKSLGLVPQSSNTRFVYTKAEDGEVMFIEIIRDDDEPQNESPNEGEGIITEGPAVEYFNTVPTIDELTHHKYLMCGPIKLGTQLVLSARSYPTENPQSSTHIHSLINAITIHPKQPEESQVNEPNVGSLGNINSNPHPQPDPLASIAIEQVRKLNSMLKSIGLVPQSSNTRFVCTK